ncbi:S-adenosyl-L-methionine-dependent methyltransferase [Fomitopsis betulina]|nr:S-adenosyl-L-methionine-dependent methyltransferase [Fomitopsis betulina]
MLLLDDLLRLGYVLLDKGLLPDFLIRLATRFLLRQRLRDIDHGSFEANHAAKMRWIEAVRAREKIADMTKKANEQHYEVPTDFMLSCLGPYAKYSSCLYPTGNETLEEAEILMMQSYCEKAAIIDGMDVLDLGCGWGSLSLYLAQKYPKSRIVGLSNSHTQKAYIESSAESRGLHNVEIITADINDFVFSGDKQFDRIVSIEMFEHMKNYKALLRKVASWLRADGLLFVHIFCHRTTPYHFADDDSWMATHFFSGGTMPSHDLLLYFQDDVDLVRSWYVNGRHYARTCEDWLVRQDANAPAGIRRLETDATSKGVGAEEGRKMFYRFRAFYMACAEMKGGGEYGVGHYLFRKQA